MNNSNFSPNWASKTTRNRLNKILSFAENYFCWSESTRRLHSSKLKIHFGQQQNDLSKYLTNSLLARTGNYIPSIQSYEYKFSWFNLLYFMNKSGLVTDEEVKLAGIENLHKKEIEEYVSLCLLDFQEDKAKTFFDAWSLERNWSELKFQNAEYKIDEFTLRRTHIFQSKSKIAKGIFWKGWYDYDVEACSYTLIHQHLMNIVIPWWGKTKFTYDTIKEVYINKSAVRTRLMKKLGISEDLVKVLLSTILFNAKLVNHSKTVFYKKLVKEGLPAREIITLAQEDEFIKKLICELRNAWHKMFIYWNRTNNKSCREMFRSEIIDRNTGEITKKKFNSARMRSRIYFELERQISNVFDEFMSGQVYHLMHDGFFTKYQINKSGLVKLIQVRTGFLVNISEEIIK